MSTHIQNPINSSAIRFNNISFDLINAEAHAQAKYLNHNGIDTRHHMTVYSQQRKALIKLIAIIGAQGRFYPHDFLTQEIQDALIASGFKPLENKEEIEHLYNTNTNTNTNTTSNSSGIKIVQLSASADIQAKALSIQSEVILEIASDFDKNPELSKCEDNTMANRGAYRRGLRTAQFDLRDLIELSKKDAIVQLSASDESAIGEIVDKIEDYDVVYLGNGMIQWEPIFTDYETDCTFHAIIRAQDGEIQEVLIEQNDYESTYDSELKLTQDFCFDLGYIKAIQNKAWINKMVNNSLIRDIFLRVCYDLNSTYINKTKIAYC